MRSDEIAAGGDIVAQIFNHLMDDDYVVADISYPNPNVWYELALRHSCRSGTVLLRQKSMTPPPFDVLTLRHIEYEDTGAGVTQLGKQLKMAFDEIDANPERPDNAFLGMAGPRFPPPPPDRPYVLLQVGRDGKMLWDYVRAH